MSQIYISILPICLLSIMMCILCIFLYIKQKKIANKAFFYCKTMTHLLELLLCTNTIINLDGLCNSLCEIQGIAFILVYTLLIECNLIILLKIYFELKAKKFKIRILMIISITISITFCVLMRTMGGNMKFNDIYCSLHRSEAWKDVMFYLFNAIIFLYAILILVLLLKIYKIARSRVHEEEGLCEYLLNYAPFPIMFALCNSVMLIRNIINTAIEDLNSDFELLIAAVCISRSHGFINGAYTLWLYKKHLKKIKINTESVDSYLIFTILGIDNK